MVDIFGQFMTDASSIVYLETVNNYAPTEDSQVSSPIKSSFINVVPPNTLESVSILVNLVVYIL